MWRNILNWSASTVSERVASPVWRSEYFENVSPLRFCARSGDSCSWQHSSTDMRLSHTLLHQRCTPCFPQIDLAMRGILYEKRPRFVILFSHQTTSYSQIFFTHPSYVPDEDIFYDYPTGCPNPCCLDDCEMIRFPRRGLEGASVLQIKTKERRRRVRAKDMCNWIDCDISFGEVPHADIHGSSSSEGSEASVDGSAAVEPTPNVSRGQYCSKCKLVKYCSLEHQRNDWSEHRRVCVKAET